MPAFWPISSDPPRHLLVEVEQRGGTFLWDICGETPFSEILRGGKLAIDEKEWIRDLADQVEVESPF